MQRKTDPDHDLLLALHEQMKQLRAEIQDLKDSTFNQTGDHETRIRVLENFKSIIFGGLILSNALILPIIIWLVIRALGGK